MKIALFLEAYLSQANASATHVSLLAEGLVKLGHEVLIVTTDPETDRTASFTALRNRAPTSLDRAHASQSCRASCR